MSYFRIIKCFIASFQEYAKLGDNMGAIHEHFYELHTEIIPYLTEELYTQREGGGTLSHGERTHRDTYSIFT